MAMPTTRPMRAVTLGRTPTTTRMARRRPLRPSRRRADPGPGMDPAQPTTGFPARPSVASASALQYRLRTLKRTRQGSEGLGTESSLPAAWDSRVQKIHQEGHNKVKGPFCPFVPFVFFVVKKTWVPAFEPVKDSRFGRDMILFRKFG